MDVVDMRGKPCPIPVIEAKKLLANAPAGSSVALMVDNDAARQNLQKLADGLGHAFQYETTGDGCIIATFAVREPHAPDDAQDGGGLTVAIGANVMGRGDDELGGALMKSFIFSLTELEVPPECVLFFNSGVRLTCDGSAALADLAALTAKGVVVNSCGTCLNFHGLTDQLKVGDITNMYAILAAMAGAKRLINL
jgi:selenium metabolism protein YedF